MSVLTRDAADVRNALIASPAFGAWVEPTPPADAIFTWVADEPTLPGRFCLIYYGAEWQRVRESFEDAWLTVPVILMHFEMTIPKSASTKEKMDELMSDVGEIMTDLEGTLNIERWRLEDKEPSRSRMQDAVDSVRCVIQLERSIWH